MRFNTTFEPNPLPTAVFVFVLACWVLFWVAFLFHKKPPKQTEQKRDRASLYGVWLESIAYFVVWFLRRQLFTPIFAMPKAVEIIVAILTCAIAVGSGWIANAAIRTLGKQWTFVARVVEGHKLVTEGPYRIVRNPIYTAMFGMLLATGLAWSRWWALLLGICIFLIGNQIRVNAEEKLLRESFGKEFDEYAQRVPALIPRLF